MTLEEIEQIRLELVAYADKDGMIYIDDAMEMIDNLIEKYNEKNNRTTTHSRL